MVSLEIPDDCAVEQGKRLDLVLNWLNVRQKGFAKISGISQGHVSAMLHGKKNISYESLNRIAHVIPEISINWLLTGLGSMFVEVEKTYKQPDDNPQKVGEPDSEYRKDIPLDYLPSMLKQMQADIELLKSKKRKKRVDGTD